MTNVIKGTIIKLHHSKTTSISSVDRQLSPPDEPKDAFAEEAPFNAPLNADCGRWSRANSRGTITQSARHVSFIIQMRNSPSLLCEGGNKSRKVI
ncbi:hypothetical protein CDAR_581671 [Caerostris darwini]|uniref:Uncharacterized protein n=1 Tax=Caerostris darwini TaxID=1538125 RepID=A0AAV4X6J0_9ARAC|nr:hypothetical protein CDAR_581671 [Caerostris darwini]